MTRTRKSPEQRQAEAEALHATLVEQVEALTSSEGWARFLQSVADFHDYSLNNLLLILAQYPDASRVAGFRQWQARGRQVRKGERGIRIFGYSTKRVTVEDEHGDEVEKAVPRFPILTVFDVTQTDPIPGAETVAHPAARLHGDDPGGITDAVATWLGSWGWSFERAPIAGQTNGYTKTDGTRRVIVRDDVEPAQAAKTALHEAAHVILHADEPVADYVEHRGRKETEAESVAYVSAAMLGLDTSAYSVGYIAEWSNGDLDLIRQSAANVIRAVHVLSEAFTDPDEDRDNLA